MSKRHEQSQEILMHTFLLAILTAAITVWGLLALYKSLALGGNWEHFLCRQSIWVLSAWVIFFLLCKVKFTFLYKWVFLLTGIGAASLLFLPIFGLQINGMNGWYELGSLTIQPSEITKALYILALVKIMNNDDWSELARFTAACAVVGVFSILLLLQPDLGTTVVYLAGGVATLYFCRAKIKYLLFSGAMALLAAAAAILIHPYMRSRLINFFDPAMDPAGGGWHSRQFAIAVARGEWFGVKSDMAVWSNSFLPLSHNDSIFAGMCEMLGFCGAVVLLMLYIAWFYQMYALSYWRHNALRRMVINSMASMIMIQTLLHIMVNLGLLPPTGVTLPLVSYGGSSAAGTMIMLSIIISAGSSRTHKKLH